MFEGREYTVREELGANYGVYAGDADEPFLHSDQETLAIKEDFRFAEPESGEEVLWVKAESVLDVAAAYDVVAERTGEYVGSIQRSVSSMLRHDYEIRDHQGDLLATIEEASWLGALIRRQLTDAIPFTYHITGPDGQEYGEISEGIGFRDEYVITLEPADEEAEAANPTALDPRLAVVAIVIIDEIEGL